MGAFVRLGTGRSERGASGTVCYHFVTTRGNIGIFPYKLSCLSVIAIASPAGSLPGCRARPIRSGERRRSGSPESRRFKANPLLFASAPGPLTYIEFYPCRFMLAASVIKRRVSDRQAQASLNCEQIE